MPVGGPVSMVLRVLDAAHGGTLMTVLTNSERSTIGATICFGLPMLS